MGIIKKRNENMAASTLLNVGTIFFELEIPVVL